MVVPSKTVSIEEKEKIIITSRKIAKGLEIKGPFNIQYIVKNGEVYVIETNLRASRSMPFVSKVSGVNLMDMASYAITGGKIEEGEASIDRFGVKSPVFSFMRMKGMDPLTGVEMVSTGEVAAFSESFNEALINSIIASGVVLPKRGDGMLFSVGKNKSKAVDIAKKMMSLNLRVFATKKTSDALRRSGVECETLFKTSEGKQPKVLDYLEKGEIKLVINTPSPDNIAHNTFSDGFLIRRKAVDFRIPLITNFELADALTKALG
jgi:carbamoyl-phosphate synthase large subunit